MTFSIANFNFKETLNKVDWKLLLFLVLFLDVKIAVKIVAVILIYLLQFNFKLGFSIKNSRLPLFYLLIIAIAFIDLFINKSYGNPYYYLVFFIGIGFWLLCILAIHQVKLSVESNDTETIHRTILVFFVINTILSFYNIAHIMWETGTINPYRYQGQYQKYFIGTGDYIKGLTFDTSTTNAILNAFGVIYFLTKKNPAMVLICMAVLLLTGSNFVNIILLLILALLFVFKSTRNQKSIIVICLAFLVIFMAKVSPQNDKYVAETIQNALHPKKQPTVTAVAITKISDSITGPEAVKRRIAIRYLDSLRYIIDKKKLLKLNPALVHLPKTNEGRILVPIPDINTLSYQSRIDTTAEQTRLLAFIHLYKWKLPISGQQDFKFGLPGKVSALLQTVAFFQLHPAKIIAGDGMGNFSSKLAFRATGLSFAGGYPAGQAFINNDFFSNHLDLYLNYFSRRSGLHSLTNSPYSVYDQMLTEYGVLGLIAFALYYLWFFGKHYKRLTYGIPLLLLIMAIFFIDYWFEQLSVLVFFELMLLLNIKETSHLKPVIYAR